MGRVSYLRRIFTAYLTGRESHLTFWHEDPRVNENFVPGILGEYYMPFSAKADYQGQYDEERIPLLDYHGSVGTQYNPIAIAQYGLGNHNLYRRTGEESRRSRFMRAADWLAENLEETPYGTWVWNHHFDWEYRDKLIAPWYSALSQGQGISVLVRAHQDSGNEKYLSAAKKALDSFKKETETGGVTYRDGKGHTWFEEAIVDPPTHILNGFIWAVWGVYDYFLHTGDPVAHRLFQESVKTLCNQLPKFDTGFWSLYEQSGTRMKMVASPFYHSLHIVQLRVMHRLTQEGVFQDFADRWERYQKSSFKRSYALAYKAIFKLLYY